MPSGSGFVSGVRVEVPMFSGSAGQGLAIFCLGLECGVPQTFLIAQEDRKRKEGKGTQATQAALGMCNTS